MSHIHKVPRCFLEHGYNPRKRNKGKTEFVLYGSHPKLSKQSKMDIKIYNQTINETKSYKYLGVDLDNHLNLHQYFENVYKKASARIKLLSRIREKVSPHVAESIYKTMIRPILLYCYSLQLSLPQGAITKLQRIQDRAARIVNPRTMTMPWDSIEKIRNTRVASDVFKSLHNLLPKGLNSYFKIHHHKINTRGNGSYIFLPKMRTETGKKSFAYQGACIYNRLEKSIREETSILLLKKKLELSKTL